MTGIDNDVRALVEASVLARAPLALVVGVDGEPGVTLCQGEIGDGTTLAPSTPMYAASLAKQVVGLLAAQLVVDGRLDPDAPLVVYLDGLPGWGERVRVRHLVHHTSGLDDARLDRRGEVGHGGDNRDNAAVLELLRGTEAWSTEPGTAFRYSNLGYIGLAEVVRRAAGQRIDDAARQLFAELGMVTAILGRSQRVVAGHATPPATVGDGGLWLSVGDLGTWNRAMNARVLGDDVHALAEQPGQLDDGSPLDYAWGVRVREHGGRRTVSHGGSWPTWSAKAIRQPEAGVAVALLTSSDDAEGTTSLALALADAAR